MLEPSDYVLLLLQLREVEHLLVLITLLLGEPQAAQLILLLGALASIKITINLTFTDCFPVLDPGASGGFPGVEARGGKGDSTTSAAAAALVGAPQSPDSKLGLSTARPRILSSRTSNLLLTSSCYCFSSSSAFFLVSSSSCRRRIASCKGSTDPP